MSIKVGSIVKPRTDKDNLGLGKIKQAVERKPLDGPRTYRWIVEFTLPNGSTEEREFTSRQLEFQAPTNTRKQATAKQNGKQKTGPSRNQRRKERKRQAEKPLSEEASALMQAMMNAAAGGEKNRADALDPKNNGGISDSSNHTNDLQKQTTQDLPLQPLLSDPKYSSSSSNTSACTGIDSRTISKGSRVMTRSND